MFKRVFTLSEIVQHFDSWFICILLLFSIVRNDRWSDVTKHLQGDPGMKGVFATRVSGSADLYQVLLCYFFMGMLVYPLLTILLARLSLLSATTSFWDLQFAQCFSVFWAARLKLCSCYLYGVQQFFFLEHVGELRIISLEKKSVHRVQGEKSPQTHTHTLTRKETYSPHIALWERKHDQHYRRAKISHSKSKTVRSSCRLKLVQQ